VENALHEHPFGEVPFYSIRHALKHESINAASANSFDIASFKAASRGILAFFPEAN